jgi:hypothetical protein
MGKPQSGQHTTGGDDDEALFSTVSAVNGEYGNWRRIACSRLRNPGGWWRQLSKY